MEEINGLMPEGNVEYTEDNIRHLDDMEHIRVRSGISPLISSITI